MSKQTISHRKALSPVTIIWASLCIVFLAIGVFFFYRYNDINQKYKQLTLSEEERTRQTVSDVSKLYSVPSYDEEKPATYVVTDPEQLKSNVFFNDTQKDDVLLTYPNADIAILYRPVEKKIIKSGSYREVASGEVKIVLIAQEKQQATLEATLKTKYNNLAITTIAPKTVTKKGIVVDVSGGEEEAAKTLAGLLNYDVGALPSGESVPDGTTLVIVAPTVGTNE